MKIQMKSMLNTIVGFTFLWKFISSFVKLPSALSFFPDVLLIGALFIWVIRHRRLEFADLKFPKFVLVFFVICTISFFVNFDGYRSFFYFIWGLRNQFRFFVFYLMGLVYLKNVDYEKVKKTVYWLLYLEVAIVSVQFFVLDLRNDFASGIFGIEQGGNGIVNVFICVISIWALVDYMNRNISAKRAAILIFLCLYLAALTEIKFYFIEIVLFAAITVFVVGNTSRKMKIIAGTALALVVASQS